MKRPCSPSQPRTPKRIKLAHPTDSPNNPFSPPKPISSSGALPPVTSLRHHLPLRFQIKGTRTFRVASVPRNYTFVHLQAVIEWLFRGVTDAIPLRRFSKRIFSSSRDAKSKAETKPKTAKLSNSKGSSPVPRKIKLAAMAGDDGPKFKVLVEVEKYESKFKSTFLEGVITSGRKIVQLSTRHDPFRRLLARPTSPSPGSSFSAEEQPLVPETDDEEADIEDGSWVWEHPEEFTVGNAWPDGIDEKRGIVFHQHRHQEVHITVNTLAVKRLVGKRNDPYVFIAKGEGKLEYPDRDPNFQIDLDDNDRFGYGYGGSHEPDPQELELTFWNKADRGHKQCKGWLSFDEFFASHRSKEVALSFKRVQPPLSPVSPKRRDIRPLPRKKLVFPDFREQSIAPPSTPARSIVEDDLVSHPPTSSPCSEPGLSFSSSPVAGTSTGPTTPESPDEQSALHYWLGLGVDEEDLEVKKPVSAALAVRSVLAEGLLSDDEDAILPPMPSTPRRLRPCMSEPGSPLSDRLSVSPHRPRPLHHSVSLPRLNLYDPTPYPSSKLVRQRIDHWAERRLARLTKKGLDDGVFKRLEVGNEAECFPCRDDGGEVDELDTDEEELSHRSPSKSKSKSKPRRGSLKTEPVHQDDKEAYYSDHYFSCGVQRMREESVEL